MVSSESLAVPESLIGLLPAEVVKADQYFGSFVRLDCKSAADQLFEVRVYLADWIFLDRGAVLADSSGEPALNNPKLAALNGAKLLQVSAPSAGELWLMFTADLSLKLIANLNEYEPDDELLIASLDVAFLKFSPAKGFTAAPPVRTEH